MKRFSFCHTGPVFTVPRENQKTVQISPQRSFEVLKINFHSESHESENLTGFHEIHTFPGWN